ncbi:uncharacterized protein isoform X2 [Leptinotarsa decemlineata]|uniref:uncharacterized protein isoform X2 n=1 Tax=Leptinotarsa decemlineata TaxID=7539 RepID=UPI003D307AF4
MNNRGKRIVQLALTNVDENQHDVDESFVDSGSEYFPSDQSSSSSASSTHDTEIRVLLPVVDNIEGSAQRERKRRLVAKPELWKKNKMQLLRVAGKEYVNRKVETVIAMSPGDSPSL